MYLAADLGGNPLRDLQDFVVQRRRLVVLVHRVDRRDEHRASSHRHGLDEPQRRWAGADQVPVRVGQKRACDRRMMVSILDDDIGLGGHGMSYDAFVQRMVPDCRGANDHPVLAHWLGELFQIRRMVPDDLVTGFLQGRRVEQPVAAQILVVITDEQVELRAGVLREPGGAAQRRLCFHGRVDDDKNSAQVLHSHTCGYAARLPNSRITAEKRWLASRPAVISHSVTASHEIIAGHDTSLGFDPRAFHTARQQGDFGMYLRRRRCI